MKRQKNDSTDAEAIVVAAQRPEMRFVVPKNAEQQARAVLFSGQERLLHQRTELVNALRATLHGYGHTVPQGIGHLKRIEAILDGAGSVLQGSQRPFPFIGEVFADAGLRVHVWPKPPPSPSRFVKRRPDQVSFAVQPRRWVVERFFAWFSRNQRI